ncbi:uncharacterized protein KY384_002550 [Bacidia gigantensis]|uniref:uncharacterized protein n=1 Tax=Bacidia gigantensis TaxID=2732470 RepID=UPI001D053E0B|nr:uncharacterized protein KY384_002550 [Bacidia gigantensis]KAG8532673.1 hypothetical protein KY384_002550 [Bacidia gigantensis]
MVCKIVAIGAIEGHFEIFAKLTKLHKKTSFSFGLALGDLFADPAVDSDQTKDAIASLVSGGLDVPFPIYFSLGRHPLPVQVRSKLEDSGNGELCPNLYYLGKRSTTITSERIRIVALGGAMDSALTAGHSKDDFLPLHTESDVRSLYGAHKADILISNYWPANVLSHSNVTVPATFEEPPSEACLAELCANLRPRYYFSSSPQFFFEREPFIHNAVDTLEVTRFISIASFVNNANQKSLYAFSFNPSAVAIDTTPPNATATPFVANRQKHSRSDDRRDSQHRFSQNNDQHYRRDTKRARRPLPGPESCFFCLSNPNVATHLITSIGNDSYLTTAKGPLTTSKTFPHLEFPGHILIIPLSHSPTFTSINPPETAASTYQEMTRYRKSLQSLVSATSNGTLGSVTWEISRANGIHNHWQFLPAPVDMIRKGLVEAGFKVEAENERYAAFKEKDIGDGAQEEDFLRVWLWDPHDPNVNVAAEELRVGEDGKEQSLILQLHQDARFSLQFPRKVMSRLLGLEHRLQWQDCEQNDVEEKAEADTFKKAYEAFDFTLKE